MAKYYVTLPNKMKQQLFSKCPGKLSKGILFIQVNAVPHKATISLQKLADLHSELLKHPDLVASVYFIFLKLKKHLKGRQFPSTAEATKDADGWFEAQPK